MGTVVEDPVLSVVAKALKAIQTLPAEKQRMAMRMLAERFDPDELPAS